jgi:hypothetical protein
VKDHLTIDEASELLRLSRKAVEARVARGSLPSVLRNGRRLIPADPIERLARELESTEVHNQTVDSLAEKYAQARYEVGVRDGEARARAQLTEGHERRERELQDRLIELTAERETSQAIAQQLELQLSALKSKKWWRRSRPSE